MSLFGKLQRERTNPRVKATTTFNAPGTYFPEYGKTVFTVGGRGESGSSNPPTPGNTNPTTGGVVYQDNYVRKDAGPPDVTNEIGPAPYPLPSPYCDPTEDISNNSTIYNFHTRCYTFGAVPGDTNPATPGNSNTGANANLFGVPFPGGVGGLAPVVGDTTVNLAFSNSGYSVSAPTGGYVTFKNK